MKRDPLDSLVERLSDGDMAAAERVFVVFEPYLRMVVRRKLSTRLRTKFDSIDIVQSVWAHVLSGFRAASWRFANATQLRAFLVRVTQNRMIDQWRRCRTAVDREQPLSQIEPMATPASRQPSACEIAQAGELWERMLVLCPTAHRDVLQLRQQGVTVSEIATRTGLHEGSVHRILHALACRVSVERASRLVPSRQTR
ncbi:RNA polymerase sigma factor [Singulisphaera acidiphila]|uniref:DNA-directed RNA polymerase specialized sigma subunit, sigma24 n=1 Tax=Singulisphaera acidiphila (strain ATCC BAA-1392 / DSM 18658 / VKM B-2454 / MOB10) TaxID=886293 RepID=L0DCU8_SINAD|nr:RNA polymerase sigma factor [Singulisphaera acidiphila]AGA26695.1 DNA-directed RNA polymerase specialized sigma subunit, sigma24 [Singulisphaera acidiphila DSM 18658]